MRPSVFFLWARKYFVYEADFMNFLKLNPCIHSVALYERLNRSEPCVAPDSKIVYLISGELTYTISDGKRERLSPGNLLYIPAGTKCFQVEVYEGCCCLV